jgi:hypothetical protein
MLTNVDESLELMSQKHVRYDKIVIIHGIFVTIMLSWFVLWQELNLSLWDPQHLECWSQII